MGLPQTDVVTLPVDPIQLIPTYDAALAAFKALPPVRVLFDNGAGQSAGSSSSPGDPYRRVRQGLLGTSPCPGTTARTWYFGAGGTLARRPRRPRAASTRSPPNANALPLTDFGTNTGYRRAVGQRVAVAVELAAEPGRHRGLVRLRAAHREHHGHRQRRRAPLGAVVDARRRPAGDDQRGAAGRERDVRAERLDPRQRAQAVDRLEQHVQAAEHDARADPDLHRGRRGADAGRTVRQGRRAALLPGPRVPHGLAHPGDDRRAERHAADLVVQPDAAEPAPATVSIAFSATMPSSSSCRSCPA